MQMTFLTFSAQNESRLNSGNYKMITTERKWSSGRYLQD